MQGRSISKRWFLAGLVAVMAYVFSVHPPDFKTPGYAEDLCGDSVRQLMAESIQDHGGPAFRTDRVMAPQGASIPFMSWTIERDWVGAYFWMWKHDFPFLWFYFGLSLIATYLGVGAILRGMRLDPAAAWSLAALVTVFHIPRHFKIYHHYDHVLLHWAYWGIFLDAWIWQRVWRDKRWPWVLELWRGVCLLGTFGISGYYWGPMILEWVIARICIAGVITLRFRRGVETESDGRWRAALWPMFAGILLLAAEIRWFLPLKREVGELGSVTQLLAWHAKWVKVVEPLWWQPLLTPLYALFPKLPAIAPIDGSETVVTIGWLLWVPAIAGLLAIRRKRGGPGIGTVLPVLIFFVLIYMYLRHGRPYSYPYLLQKIVPFMNYFRVASRMGIFLPMVAVALVALTWPELSRWFRERWEAPRAWRGRFRPAFVVFCALSAVELGWLAYPIGIMPPMENSLQTLLARVREAPGTTVLDMPFCTAGGNGVCTGSQCPNYPKSTIGLCMRVWHEKKVYGLYQARMVQAHCENYGKAPFTDWFAAWAANRCFTPREWDGFCGYLESRTELAGILLYPEIWPAVQKSECRAELERRLGQPLGEAPIVLSAHRGGIPKDTGTLRWYAPRCGAAKP